MLPPSFLKMMKRMAMLTIVKAKTKSKIRLMQKKT